MLLCYRVSLGAFKRREVSILYSVKHSLLDMTAVSSCDDDRFKCNNSLHLSFSPSLFLSLSPLHFLGSIGTNEDDCQRVGCCWDPKDVSDARIPCIHAYNGELMFFSRDVHVCNRMSHGASISHPSTLCRAVHQQLLELRYACTTLFLMQRLL